MTNTTSLLRCAHCARTAVYDLESAEHDRGEWILRCPLCDSENVLAYSSETLVIKIAGWRD